MLQSLDGDDLPVLAWLARRGDRFRCPHCRERTLLKRGAIVVPHFAHVPGAVCPFARGESLRHLQMKQRIGELFVGANPRFEVPIRPGHRADVVLFNRVVVECQVSPLMIAEWQARTRDYNRRGYAVLWVWDGARLGRPPGEGTGEQRVPAEVRHCHRRAFGRVYALCGEELRACHLFPAEARERCVGGSRGRYVPRALRVPAFQEPRFRLTLYRGAGGEHLAHLGEGVWWKGGPPKPPAPRFYDASPAV